MPNGGRRIFPGKRYVIDPSANIRNKVSLEAEIQPAKDGCTVTFRVFDVDDPFDQNNSTMPNVVLIDGNASGPDNRGADPGVGTWTGTTDAAGKARVDITVSMQPGNNYRAAASVIRKAVQTPRRVNDSVVRWCASARRAALLRPVATDAADHILESPMGSGDPQGAREAGPLPHGRGSDWSRL